MNAARLLIDAPAGGPWNMAVDETLLAAAIKGRPPVLRFYQWAPATLSLGYFQRAADRDEHAASRAAPLVRRASGGGAILHDRELTYSLALPPGHPLARSPERVYDVAHDVLVGWLAQRGIRAERFWPTDRSKAPPPFLCFQRRAPGDVIVAGAKIAGSAQRRRAGAVLQHGSLLLATSPAAPELPGLAEAARCLVAPEELALELAPRLASAFDLRWEPSSLTEIERRSAEPLAAQRFAADEWNLKR